MRTPNTFARVHQVAWMLIVPIFFAATAAASQPEFPIAITGVKVVNHGGPSYDNATILIENGRIVAVGDDITPPPHAEVISADGMIAYPGFFSAHAYLGIPEEPRDEAHRQRTEDENPDHRQRALPETRRANRRGIYPQYRAEEHYAPSSDDIDKFREAGFTTVLAAPRGGIFGGTSAVVSMSDAPIRRSLVATGLAQHASFSVWEPGAYPNSLLGVFAEFRQALLDAQWSIERERFHRRHPRRAERPPSDPALRALRPVLSGAIPVVFQANSEHEINRALNLAEEFNLKIIISGAKQAHKVIDRLEADDVPVIVSLKFDEEPEYGKDTDKGSKKEGAKPETSNAEEPEAKKESNDDKDRIYEPLKLRRERRRLWEEQVTNIVALHEAGVEFALATGDLKNPSELLKNLRMVIDRGFPVDAALAALTHAPARMFHMANQLGRIEAGQLANVVVMTRSLDDEKTKTRWVFADGKKFEFNRDDDKEKTDGDKKDKADADEPDDPAEEPDVAETDTDEDQGPTWRCEIEADRTPATRTGGDVLIRNATVITVSGPTLENTSILIQDGKIIEIGPDVSEPPDITVIDATGQYVIPGMIDCHSHMAIDGINESALSISAEVRVADTVRNDSVGIFRALAGGVTTTHAMHGSANPVGGQNVVFKLKYKRPVGEMIVDDAPRTMKWALGENVKQSNWPNAHGKRFPNGRMGVEAVLRDAMVAGWRYDREWVDYRAAIERGRDVLAPRRDLRLEALAEVLRGDIWVHTHCYRSDEIVRLMAVAEDFGIRIAVLQHILEGYRIAPEIARHGAAASTFSNFWAYKIEAYGAVPHNAALMTQHGITTTINSDSPNTIRYFGIEAAKSIKWGDLNENQALRLVTLNAAIQLGLEDRLGSIEVGKDGDLAIFNGHPLNTYARNVMTLIEGEVFFADTHVEPVVDAGPFEWNRSANRGRPVSPHQLYAIVGGTVHPVSRDPIPNGTVVIRNGLIDAVGANLDIPPGAGVVDATGLHVYPGLIDGGGSLGLTEVGSLRATRDNFDIARFAPELRTASAIHPHSAHIRIARTAGTTTQLVKPTGGTISGRSALVNLDGWTADEMLVRDDVALHMSIPSLPARLTGEKKEERKKDHETAVREIEEFLRKARRYAAAVDAGRTQPELAPDRDLRLEAMIPYVRGEKPVIVPASSYKPILDAIEFSERNELRIIITGGTQAWKLADVLAEKNIPVILSRVLSYPRGGFESWDSIYRCAADLERAGVRWCFATDSAPNAYDLGSNAGMAVAHGLHPDRALHALTLGAADVLGVSDRLGSLDVGKQADIIVTTHAPMQTVAQVTHMFVRGRPIELTSLHTENYEKFKNRPKPNLPPAKQLTGPPSMTGR